MKKSMLDRVAEALLDKKRKQRWLKIVGALGCVVVFCTTYALILPALTLAQDVVCGLEEHTHSDACYTSETVPGELRLKCDVESLELHSHTSSCYDANHAAICGYADYIVHTHVDACYEDGALVCPLTELKEHTHSSSCYTQTQELTCGLEEDENAHAHSESCYTVEQTLTCGQEEAEGVHTHSEECYTENQVVSCGLEETPDAHVHGDACYTAGIKLICVQPEVKLHAHVDSCFVTSSDGTKTLTCTETEVLEHVHNDGCFEAKEQTVISCGLEEHTHNEECYPDETTAATTEATTAPVETTAATTEATIAPVETTTETTSESETAGDIPMLLSEGEEVGTRYTIATENGVTTLTITGTGAMADYNNWSNEPGWYEDASSVQRIVIESGVTHVGAYAFFDFANVTEVVLSDSVTSIGQSAFEFNYALSKIELPENLESVGSMAFAYTGITSVTVPASISSMGSGVFFGCESLTEITLEDGISALGSQLVAGTAVKYLTIPGSVKTIPSNLGTGSLTSLTLCEGIETIESNAISCESMTSLTIPGSVKTISEQAACCCDNLTSLTISEGVEAIESYAFTGLGTSITEVTIPASVTEVTGLSFDSSYITAFRVAEGSASYASVDGTLYSADMSTLVAVPKNTEGEYTVSEGITAIGSGAFANSGVTSVKIREGYITIGGDVFLNCGETVSGITEGTYYADSNGILYYIAGGVAYVSYQPDATVTPLTEIPTEADSSKTYPVSADSSLVASGVEGSLSWIITQTGEVNTLILYGTGEINDYIHDDKDGVYVTPSWADYSFQTVVIPEGITRIGDYAFYGSALQEVTVPASVKSIGTDAFAFSNALSSVTLNEGLETLDDRALSGTAITGITIPDSVVSIGSSALNSCRSLESVALGENLKTIGTYAFAYTALTEVVIPDTVTSIGKEAFAEAPITSITVPANAEYELNIVSWENLVSFNIGEGDSRYKSIDGIVYSADGTTVLRCPCAKTGGVEIPAGVTSIADGAFANTKIDAITFPEGHITLGSGVFTGNTNLPRAISGRPQSAYSGLGAGTYYVDSAGNIYQVLSGLAVVVYQPDSTSILPVTIPNEQGEDGEKGYPVGTIVDQGDVELTDAKWMVYERDGVYTLVVWGTGKTFQFYQDSYAYIDGNRPPWQGYAEKINRVVVSEGITTLGEGSFSGMTALTEVSIPSTVTTFEGGVFSSCTALTSIEIPDTVTDIGRSTFMNCKSLTTVKFPANLETIGFYVFNKCTSLTSIEIPDTVRSIGDYSFENCTALTSIDIPEGVTRIGYGVFEGCTALSEVSLPEGLKEIGSAAFKGCTALKTVDLPEGLESMEGSAFAESGLTEVVIPKGITTLGYRIFGGCTSLTFVELPASLTSIDREVFSGCTALRSIALPDTLTSIGSKAFNNCISLTSVEFPDSLSEIDSYAFAGCTALEKITLPEGLEKVSSYMFQGCTALKSVKLPESLVEIQQYAFADTGLTEITIPDGVTTIGTYAFSGCEDLQILWAPEGHWTMKASAFASCSGLSKLDEAVSGTFYTDENGAVYQIAGGCAFFQYSPVRISPMPSTITDAEGVTYTVITDNMVIAQGSINSDIAWVVAEDSKGERILILSGTGTIPTNAGNSWSAYKSSIDQIVIREGITGIAGTTYSGSGSLAGHSDLDQVILPDGDFSIGTNAFYNCASLKEVVYPGESLKIESNAFNSCSSLTELTLDQGYVQLNFSSDAFSGVDLNSEWGNLPVGQYYLDNYGALFLIIDEEAYLLREPVGMENYLVPQTIPAPDGLGRYPAHSVEVYTTSWLLTGDCCDYTAVFYGEGTSGAISSTYRDQVKHAVFKDGITQIGSSSLNNCTNLEDVSIEGEVTTIGNGAFFGCRSLKAIDLPESLIYIESSAFGGCRSLTEITVPEGVTRLSSSAFSSCTNLQEVTLPSSLTYIDNMVFMSCTSLEKIVIPDSVTTIWSLAFYGCSSLTDVTLSKSLNAITDSMFQNCTSLVEISLPESVTTIGNSVFAGCTALENVVISEGVTSIGNKAFADCTAMEEIAIPDSVTRIADLAFQNCTSLTSVSFQPGYVTLGTDVFSGCTELAPMDNLLKSAYYVDENGVMYVVINEKAYVAYCPEGATPLTEIVKEDEVTYGYPVMTDPPVAYGTYGSASWIILEDNGVTTLYVYGSGTLPDGNWYVYGEEIDRLVIDDGFTSIKTGAFVECTNLTEIQFPSGSFTMGTDVFPETEDSYFPSGDCYNSEDGFLYVILDGDAYVVYQPEGTTVPETIMDGAYPVQPGRVIHKQQNGATWYVVDLPDGTQKMVFYGGAISGYSSSTLTSRPWNDYKTTADYLEIHDSVTTIGTYAFYGFTDLDEIVMKGGGDISIGSYAFAYCSSLENADINCSTLGSYAFYNCTQLQTVKVSGSMNSIGIYAFCYCYQLESVTGTTQDCAVNKSAFSSCSNLKELSFPIKSVGEWAFYGCSSLEDINFASGVSFNGEQAFRNCTGLTKVTLPAAVTYNNIKYLYTAFRGCKNLQTINVDTANTGYTSVDGILYDDDKTTLYLCPEGKEGVVTVEDTVSHISGYAFYDCDKVTEVNLPASSIHSMGDRVFYDCDGLTHIHFPDSLGTIPAYTLYSCDSLKTVEFGGGNNYVREYAFAYCGSLTSVEMGSGVLTIDNDAFRSCTSLASVVIGPNVTTIGNYAFYNCSGMTSVEIGDKVTTIGNYAFQNCTSLTDVVIGEKVTSIGNYAFAYCTALTNLEMGESVTTIYSYAFRNCTALTSVELGPKVSYINSYAFQNCTALEEIVLNIESYSSTVNSYAFNNDKAIKYLVVGEEVDNLYSSMFTAVRNVTGKYPEVSFRGKNHFTVASGFLDFSSQDMPLRLLEAGNTYYVDEYGALYRQETVTGGYQYTLLYVPAGVESYTVPRTIVQESSGVPRQVTRVETNALSCATDLTELTFETPENILELESFALANCPTLLSVNGKTAVSEATATFTKSTIGLRILANTGLTGGPEETTEELIVDAENGGPKIGITTATNKNGEFVFYTDESTKTILTLSNITGTTAYQSRVYIEFSNSLGKLNYAVGTHNVTSETGVQYQVYVGKVADTNLYYMDLPDLAAGDTLMFDFTTYFPSPESGPAEALIWGVNIPEDTAGFDASPTVCHRLSWITEARKFNVSKSATSTPTLYGDGTEGSEVTVHGLTYEIRLTSTNRTAPAGYGEDFATSVTFTDVITLPEGLHWNEKTASFKISGTSGVTSSGVTTVFDGQKAYLTWTYTKTSSGEMNAQTIKLVVGDQSIGADKIPAAGTSFTIENDVSTVQRYTYSGDQTASAATVYRSITTTEGTLTLTKKDNGSNPYLGEYFPYTITMSNLGTHQLNGMKLIEDSLDTYLYIKGSQMGTMFEQDEAKALTIVIEGATLYNPITTDTVITASGNEKALSIQNTSIDTHYFGAEPTETDAGNIRARGATVTIGWVEGVLTVTTSEDDTVTVGDGGVQAALEEVGYFVTPLSQYNVTWDYGETGFTIWSGQTLTYSIPCNVKDSFMLISWDYPNRQTNNSFTIPANQVKVTYGAGSATKTAATSQRTAYRDYVLTNSITVNGSTLGSTDVIPAGAVVNYKVNISHKGGGTHDVIPLVTHMQGAQILLVKASGNEHLGTDYGLEVQTLDGVEYYLLDQAGTYENVVVGGYRADSVVVKEYGSNELDTLIHWYFEGSAKEPTVQYLAMPVGELTGDVTFSTYTESWLNDHQTRRLWTSLGNKGAFLEFEKHIVTEKGKTAAKDVTKDFSVIHEGDSVIYRLELTGLLSEASTQLGRTVVVPASVVFDALPKSIADYRWTTESGEVNISVTYEYDEEKVTVTGGTSWHLTDVEPLSQKVKDVDQQYLVWDDPFCVTFYEESTLYIYVTLTYPERTDWGAYANAYAAERLRNTFYVSEDCEDVYNALAVGGSAKLVKGVHSTGVYNSGTYYPSDESISRKVYINNDSRTRVVEYYVTVYNDGNARLYLNPIQDVLPKGFTFCKVYDTGGKLAVVTDDEGKQPAYLAAQVTASASGQKVKFKLTGGGLHYDDYFEMYYLMPGEATSFSYLCYTNSEASTLLNSDNTAAMEYFDYNTSGTTLGGSTITGKLDPATELNDGTGVLMDNATASEIYGFTGGTADSQWLASSVRVVRGYVVPGISKAVTKRTDAYGRTQLDVKYADYTDTITWGVTVTNSGTMPITDYTLTDVMQATYDYTGTVKYTIKHTEFGLSQTYTLFDLANISKDGEVNTVSTGIGTLEVTCKPTENGENAVLTIRFKDAKAAIPEGGSAVLEISTINNGVYRSTMYTNTCYLTPNAQTWDEDSVTLGKQVEYNGKQSIQSSAQIAVTSGFVTTSSKEVAEVGAETTNFAVSDQEVSSIVLPDGKTEVRYTLNVRTTDLMMDLLVLIDNLPEVGDHNTFVNSDLRYSEFLVSLAENPDFQITLTASDGTVTTLSASDYTLQFTDKTEFTANDWNGTNNEGWSSTKSSSTRSFRIILKYDEETDTGVLVNPESIVSVSFTAVIDSNVLPGDVAWNSFGYHYRVFNATHSELEAAPLKVGVRIPSAPTLVKKVLAPDSTPYAVEKDETFSYVIYKGTGINLDGLTAAQAAEALKDVEYTVLDLVVPQGESQSQAVMLKDQYQVTGFDEESQSWTVDTTKAWVWENGADYTIYELPIVNAREYAFGTIGGSGTNGYVYHHNWAEKVTISSVNTRRVWNIEVLKKAADGRQQVLADAWFGLYSPNEADAIAAKDLPEELKGRDYPTELSYNEKTYYLCDIAVSDEEGKLIWEKLNEMDYLVRELKAPAGYNLNEEVFFAERPEDVSFNTVNLIARNTSGYEMPESGGMGTMLFTAAGTALMAAAAGCLLISRKKRRRTS